MKIHFAAIGLTILLAATFGLAQQHRIRAKIPQEFTAAAKAFPAGQYDFIYDADKRLVTVKDTAKGPAVTIPIITMLAGAMHTTPNDSHIVFDKIGSNLYLSEIWIPGIDGICLLTTKEKHEHEVLNFP